MCGIVGYVGHREVYPILINGLKRLEYRGYDSAGIAMLNNDLKIYKKRGRVHELDTYVRSIDSDLHSQIGIGHTRWATHGEPNDINAHPHLSQSKNFAIIHNGIIENYAQLKTRLQARGYHFTSETDTEVLVHLIEEIARVGNLSAEEAVRLALMKVQGAFGLVLISRSNPNQLIAARRSSPLVIGIGQGEYFIASDATPIIEYTKNVIYLNDNEIAVVRPDELIIRTIKNVVQVPEVKTLEMELDAIEKGGYEHFMLKEIFEQPKSMRDAMRGRIKSDMDEVLLGGLRTVMDRLVNAKRIIIVACGTSWHAGLVGEYLIEDLARIPVEVEYASEFRYRNPIIVPEDIVMAISQSGETADTLAALQLAKEAGAMVLGVVNAVGSSISRITDAGVYTHVGPEIGVASTKAFTGQVMVLTLIAVRLGRERGFLDDQTYLHFIRELTRIPDLVEQTLAQIHDDTLEIARRFADASNFLYLGRGYNFPVALEGALKLKEISYIHAEGYPAAEMKHGPIALIDENMPVVFIATRDKSHEKIISNIQEVKARKGVVIAVTTEDDPAVNALADYVLRIPDTLPELVPLLSVLPLQLLSYHIAVLRGCNVDMPRNLAKSVTVE